MVTVGLSFFFKGVVELIWGTDTRVFTPPVFPLEPIRIGPLFIGQVYLWSFIAAIILLGVFVGFFQYTRWGLAMQATADDEMAALSLGVSARFVNLYFCHGCIDGPVIDNELSGFRRKELIANYMARSADPTQTEKEIQQYASIDLSRKFNPESGYGVYGFRVVRSIIK